MSDLTNFEVSNPHPKNIFELSETAFKHINELNKSSKILADVVAQNALSFLLNHSINDHSIAEMSLNYEFDKMLILLLENLYHRLLKNFQDDYEEDEDDEDGDAFKTYEDTNEAFKSQKMSNLVMASVCINLLERYTAVSPKFCYSFQNESNHGVRVLFHFINNRRIQDKFLSIQQQQHMRDNIQELVLMRNLLRSISLALAHLARFSVAASRSQWKEVNAVKNLLFYFELKKIQMDLKVELALAIGFIVDTEDAESNELSNKEVMSLLAKMISVSAKKIVSGRELNRFKGPDELYESCSVTVKQSQWTLVTVLNSIQNFTSQANFKYNFYNDLKLSKYLREIIYYGNPYEKEHAIYLLWNFSFDRQTAIHICNDSELIEYLAKIDKHSHDSSKLATFSRGVLLQSKMTCERLDLSKFSKDSSDKIRLVYALKYNDGIISRVQQQLSDFNFNLANERQIAEDKSSCLVIFLTNSLSYCCESRSRIEFALSLKKPIFAILAEENFILQGWIESIMKTEKISPIDFVKNDFDESMNKLNTLLKSVVNIRPEVKPSFNYPSEPDPSKWSETDVLSWANSMRFHPGLRASLKSCDGKLLREVFDMRQDAPQFLFKLIEDSKTIDSESTMSFNLTHFNNFCRELNSLFSD